MILQNTIPAERTTAEEKPTIPSGLPRSSLSPPPWRPTPDESHLGHEAGLLHQVGVQLLHRAQDLRRHRSPFLRADPPNAASAGREGRRGRPEQSHGRLHSKGLGGQLGSVAVGWSPVVQWQSMAVNSNLPKGAKIMQKINT